MSVASGKRATTFIIPILFIFLIINYIIINKKINFKRLFQYFFGIIIITISTLYITSQTSPYLNPTGTRWSGVFDLKYMFESMISYIFDFDELNPGAGRIASIGLVFNFIGNINYSSLLFGLGPGKLIGSFLLEGSNSLVDLDLPYGARSGFLWFSLQIGIIGSICYLLFIFNLFKSVYSKYKVNRNHKDISAILLGIIGIIFIYFFDFIIYSSSFITSGVTMPVLLYFLAIYLSPKLSVKNNFAI